MKGNRLRYLTLAMRKLLGAAVCVAALAGTSLGQEVQLSAEDVVRNALQVLSKVHDVRGSATCYSWWGDRSATDAGKIKLEVTESFYECYNMAFIGPPGGPMRVDYKEKELWDGRASPMQKAGTGHWQLFFNGEYLLRFIVDQGFASVRPGDPKPVLRDWYERFHPLSVVDYMSNNVKPDVPGQFKLVSRQGTLYAIDQPAGNGGFTYRIDQSQGFSVKELTLRPCMETLMMGFTWEIESVPLEGDIWLPKTIKRVSYSAGGRFVRERIETTFYKLEVNSGLATDDLEIALPPGTLFRDSRSGVKKIIGKDADGPRKK